MGICSCFAWGADVALWSDSLFTRQMLLKCCKVFRCSVFWLMSVGGDKHYLEAEVAVFSSGLHADVRLPTSFCFLVFFLANHLFFSLFSVVLSLPSLSLTLNLHPPVCVMSFSAWVSSDPKLQMDCGAQSSLFHHKFGSVSLIFDSNSSSFVPPLTSSPSLSLRLSGRFYGASF